MKQGGRRAVFGPLVVVVGKVPSADAANLSAMGSTLLKVGDAPTEQLKRHRLKYGGRAQLLHLIEIVVANVQSTLAGISFTLRHRPPRDLEAIEDALVGQLANVEEALAHVRRMRIYRDRPVSVEDLASHDAELQAALRSGS